MVKYLLFALVASICLAMPMIAGDAWAFEEDAILLQFNPEEGYSSRYMFQLMMLGTHVSPGLKNTIGPLDFMIGTVYKDTVEESLYGLNRHSVQFYDYNVREAELTGLDIVDSRFGGNPWPSLPGGGSSDPEGSEGPGGPSGVGSGFIGGLGLSGNPNSNRNPMQGPEGPGGPGGGGGGGGGVAGQTDNAINLETIRITNLQYVTNKQGEVLDIDGLEDLEKASKNRLLNAKDDASRQYIDINIANIFEWTHLLYLPDYPVFKDEMWFHEYPIHVPGLPTNEPVLTKFTYKLIDFQKVDNRKLAVIDMYGICEWNREWSTRTKEELTEFQSWGSMGISGRYWFDYENNVIFGIERPPFYDWQYRKSYGGFRVGIPYLEPFQFTLLFPGLFVTMEFFYNTRITDISGKPRLVELEPEVNRRHITLLMLCQLEAE